MGINGKGEGNILVSPCMESRQKTSVDYACGKFIELRLGRDDNIGERNESLIGCPSRNGGDVGRQTGGVPWVSAGAFLVILGAWWVSHTSLIRSCVTPTTRLFGITSQLPTAYPDLYVSFSFLFIRTRRMFSITRQVQSHFAKMFLVNCLLVFTYDVLMELMVSYPCPYPYPALKGHSKQLHGHR